MPGNIADVTEIGLADDGRFPNSRFPLIVYRKVLAEGAVSPEAFEHLFGENGWPPQWRASVFTYHHYHSTAHEVLGVASGSARVTFGGPKGETLALETGDVVIIPAGVAHKREESSDDFLVVGAYPPGQQWDMMRGEEGERPAADARIAEVATPITDPVSGENGPMVDAWR
ncbi:cupin domain-containing protein [Pelagibacterium halotolerans]|uniref:cupin domain-containing protein n=1 Tax=Pelagibacterium halotolerans TaxID=531813 RepID=UPI00384ECB6C